MAKVFGTYFQTKHYRSHCPGYWRLLFAFELGPHYYRAASNGEQSKLAGAGCDSASTYGSQPGFNDSTSGGKNRTSHT